MSICGCFSRWVYNFSDLSETVFKWFWALYCLLSKDCTTVFSNFEKKNSIKSSTHGLKLIKRQNWKEIYKIPFFFRNYKTRMAYISSLMEVAGEIQVIN